VVFAGSKILLQVLLFSAANHRCSILICYHGILR